MKVVRQLWAFHGPNEVADCPDLLQGQKVCLGHYEGQDEKDEEDVEFCEVCCGPVWKESEVAVLL